MIKVIRKIKRVIEGAPKDYEIEGQATRLLANYLQNWGQSTKEQINALNETLEFMWLDTKFIQKSNKETGFKGNCKDGLQARKFRQEIEREFIPWCGRFEDEVIQIKTSIRKYARW